MSRGNFKYLLMLLLIGAPGIYILATKNWYAPTGLWVKGFESCESTQLRHKFGEDITVGNDTETKILGESAIYYREPNGQLRISFFWTDGGESGHVSIDYETKPDLLVPRAVRFNRYAFMTNFPESFRQNFTFKRCPRA